MFIKKHVLVCNCLLWCIFLYYFINAYFKSNSNNNNDNNNNNNNNYNNNKFTTRGVKLILRRYVSINNLNPVITDL